MRILFILILITSFTYSQSEKDSFKQIEKYYKELGVAVPKPNTVILMPTSKANVLEIDYERYKLPNYSIKVDSIKPVQRQENRLSYFDKKKNERRIVESVLGGIKDKRVNSIEYVSKNEIDKTNSVNASNIKRNRINKSNIRVYFLGALLLFISFIAYKLYKGKS